MNEPRQGRAGNSRLLRRMAPLLVLAGIAVFAVSQGWHERLSLKTIADNSEILRALIEEHFLLALLGYSAIYIAVVAMSLPGGVYLTLAGGFLFGWLLGGAVTVVAATIGATLIFLIAKTSLGEPLAERAGPGIAKLRAGFQENALSYLLFLRLVPAFPFWLVNLAPALLGVRLGTYVLGTFIGIIPGTFAFAFAGAGLDSVIDAQRQAHQACRAANPETPGACEFSVEPSALVTRELLLAFAALGVLALLPALVKKLRKGAPLA